MTREDIKAFAAQATVDPISMYFLVSMRWNAQEGPSFTLGQAFHLLQVAEKSTSNAELRQRISSLREEIVGRNIDTPSVG